MDLNLYSGTTTVLTLQATNPGPEDWPADRIHVGTEPSAFVTDDWLSPTRPTSLAQPLAAGERAAVSFSIRAPVVTEPTRYEEFFWLEGATGPGTEGTWRITVHPPVALPILPERSYWWAWAAGFAAATLLVVLALRGRDTR